MIGILKIAIIPGKMEREVFHYMKHDMAEMPFSDDQDFESDLVESCEYAIPNVRTCSQI